MNRWLPAVLRIFLTTAIALFLVAMGLYAWEGIRYYTNSSSEGSEVTFSRAAPSLLYPGAPIASSPFLCADGEYMLKSGKIVPLERELLDLVFAIDRVRIESPTLRNLPAGLLGTGNFSEPAIALVTQYLAREMWHSKMLQSASEADAQRYHALPQIIGMFRSSQGLNAIPIGWGELSLVVERGYAARSGLDIVLSNTTERMDMENLLAVLNHSGNFEARARIAFALSESPYALAISLSVCETQETKSALLRFVEENRNPIAVGRTTEASLTFCNAIKSSDFKIIEISFKGLRVRDAFGLALVAQAPDSASRRLMAALLDAANNTSDLRLRAVSEPFNDGFSITDIGFDQAIHTAASFAARGYRLSSVESEEGRH